MRYALLVVVIAFAAAAVWAMPREPKCISQGSPVSSCSAAGCHGGGALGAVGSEQSTWAGADPHSKAYRILFNDESRRIIRNMKHSPGWEDVKDAHLEGRCLACHSYSNQVCFDDLSVNAAGDGVGCDACHGGSRDWLTLHFEPSWKSLTNKESLGYRNQKDLVTRIENCAGCHVGDATRTVNHDLIAAGHPRMAFEYARFHYQPGYKKHWKEQLPESEFELRAWFIGQAVSFRHAVERSKDCSVKGPWPELSEQSCFSCHHSLDGKSKRDPFITPSWQPWHVAIIQELAAATPTYFPGATEPKLSDVAAFDKAMAAPVLDNAAVQKSAASLLKTVDAWIADLKKAENANPNRVLDRTALRKLGSRLAETASKASDWDIMAQHYLALAAFYHADPISFSDLKDTVEKLKSLQKYPAGFTSPATFDPPALRGEFRKAAGLLGANR